MARLFCPTTLCLLPQLKRYKVMSSIFITGTDTDAGKTVVSAAIIKAVASQGVRAVGLKPIASGFDMIDGHLRLSLIHI